MGKREKKRKPPSFPGRFVTFEGGEGAGKTTLIEGLARILKERGFPVLLTREPGGTTLGLKIRKLLEEQGPEGERLVPEAELFLFFADRAQHVEQVILPALEKGVHVLCDRYHDSTLAYQGYGRGLPVATLSLHLKCLRIKPDRTYLLDLPPEAGLQRIHSGRNSLTPLELEPPSFHHRVREGYLSMARKEPSRFVVLDASKPPEELLKEVLTTYPFP